MEDEPFAHSPWRTAVGPLIVLVLILGVLALTPPGSGCIPTGRSPDGTSLASREGCRPAP